LAMLAFAITAGAHDIPNDVTVQAFLKPQGSTLNLLIRVPLRAMRDFNFPERGKTGYLDIDGSEAMLEDAATLWITHFIDVYEGSTRLPQPRIVATRLALMSDRSFTSYDTALASVTGPELPEDTTVVWDQTLFDMLLEYPIQNENARFSIEPKLARLAQHVVTVLRFLPPNGAVRALEYTGDPGLVRLDPRWYQAAFRFVDLGFHHILDGTDHLLFLFCLVIPFRKLRALIPIVTAFTVAHSITLIASAYNLAPDALWFPPLIETLIAASIVYMALENIVGAATVHHRWIIAFCFGLVHGFGFSFVLRETLQFAGTHMLASLLSFNIGVELGQLLVLILMIPALEFLFRRVVAERMGVIVLSAIVAHTAWHWMIDRYAVFRQFNITMPEFNQQFVMTLLHWAMAIVAIALLLWIVSTLLRTWPAGKAIEKSD
jgi:uncharacterized membrane-anchored protein YitT (DUF2179 family)